MVATKTGQINTESEETIKSNFDLFDVDHDGFVTPMEIEKMCIGLTPDAVGCFLSVLVLYCAVLCCCWHACCGSDLCQLSDEINDQGS